MSEKRPKLDQDALRALLKAAIGKGQAGQDKEVTEDYDFFRPRRFAPEQRENLKEFALMAERKLTASLSAALRGPFQATLDSMGEEYADRYTPEVKSYAIPLESGDITIGYMELPSPTAISLITQLLGGIVSEEIDADRKLSSLEFDLLLDMASQVVSAFSAASEEFSGPAITFPRRVLPTVPVLEGPELITEQYRLTFKRGDADEANPQNFSFVILSRYIEPIAGIVRPDELPQEEVAQRMYNHVERVRMEIKIRLDRLEVPMKEIATLESGDVLILNTTQGQPIDAITCGKVIMRGLPVQYANKKALQIETIVQDIPIE